ncbi:hypothetical protein [Pseudofrankia saprophytica]|uniref:hypothetical protein n=1 Tax=Pseudofrankia saprophytica TaxID=298655 RepID=UPI000234C149|nr:hypothetical protein [Pseudofrankia saprophytica]
MSILATAARHFPLVPQGRPTCPPLADRIAYLTDQAHQTQRQPTLNRAGHVINLAALTAADCGLPDLARQLCWQLIGPFLHLTRPLTGDEATYLLEPVRNLARLARRAGDAAQALTRLDALADAVNNHTDLIVDGQRLPLATIEATAEQRQRLRRWAWTIRLTDAIPTLTTQGRWVDAYTYAHTHRGIGLRLREGRQTQILAHATAGDLGTATSLLDTSTLTSPWETCTATCLRAYLHPATPEMIAALTGAEHALDTLAADTPHTYRIHLGLATLDLTALHQPTKARHLATRLTSTAIQTADAYAARLLLARCPHDARPTPQQATALCDLVEAAGLDLGALPPAYLDALLTATRAAHTTLTQILDRACKNNGVTPL